MVREVWAWKPVEVSQQRTQVSLACPDATVPSLPRGQLLLVKGGVPGRLGGGGWPPGLVPSTLPFSGLCLALYKCPETAVPCHGAQTCRYHPKGLEALPGGERRLALWVWHLSRWVSGARP